MSVEPDSPQSPPDSAPAEEPSNVIPFSEGVRLIEARERAAAIRRILSYREGHYGDTPQLPDDLS